MNARKRCEAVFIDETGAARCEKRRGHSRYKMHEAQGKCPWQGPDLVTFWNSSAFWAPHSLSMNPKDADG